MVFLLVVSVVGGVAALGGSALAGEHTKEEAPDLTEEANFTTVFPYQTDHYPGDQNQENGSIWYFASGAQAFHENDAEEGIWIDYIIVDASWIDYTACSTENTVVFGIDRGNNNSGTKVDEDLVQHQERSVFRDDGITVNFLDWADFAGDPPYLAPEDALVSAQGAGSNAGPCLTLTSEPGWYQVQGFMNGSIADGSCTEEGNSECQPENPEVVGVNVRANYMYVCECQSEQEARDQLGPPPNESSSTPTPTPGSDATPTPTATPQPDDTSTATPQPDDTPTATEADTMAESTPTPTQPQNDGGGPRTPSGGSGPGFGALVAILGLLGSALLLYRRD